MAANNKEIIFSNLWHWNIPSQIFHAALPARACWTYLTFTPLEPQVAAVEAPSRTRGMTATR